MTTWHCIRIDEELAAALDALKTQDLNTKNKVLRAIFMLKVTPKVIKPPPPAPRVKGMTAVLADGRRIKVL